MAVWLHYIIFKKYAPDFSLFLPLTCTQYNAMISQQDMLKKSRRSSFSYCV